MLFLTFAVNELPNVVLPLDSPLVLIVDCSHFQYVLACESLCLQFCLH